MAAAASTRSCWKFSISARSTNPRAAAIRSTCSGPAQAFFGPMVVLQNERSASDAEMFPDGFRALGLGKLVGVPTMGAVIGTGSFTLLDGSTLRTPGSAVQRPSARRTWKTTACRRISYIDNTPADFLAGHDRQVEKAIEVLKGEMK